MENNEAAEILGEYAQSLERELYGGEVPFSEAEKTARMIAALYLGIEALNSPEA